MLVVSASALELFQRRRQYRQVRVLGGVSLPQFYLNRRCLGYPKSFAHEFTDDA